jgi:hypothetical protein
MLKRISNAFLHSVGAFALVWTLSVYLDLITMFFWAGAAAMTVFVMQVSPVLNRWRQRHAPRLINAMGTILVALAWAIVERMTLWGKGG